jgi:bacterioferritin
MKPLAEELRQGVQEEIRHAEVFIQRMYALGVTPHAGQPRAPQIGRSHSELLRFGLATEADAIRLYTEAAQFCQRMGDVENYGVFSRILDDEIHHHQDLERQLAALGGR